MTLIFRQATIDDLAGIVAMLADDALGAQRESTELPMLEAYLSAFAAIDRDENNELIVVSREDHLIGVMQLTFIPTISRRGSWRAMIEGVRIHSQARSLGLGSKMLAWAIDRAKQRHCQIVQLTSDLSRDEAIRFYQKNGFVHSHAGLKLTLDTDKQAPIN